MTDTLIYMYRQLPSLSGSAVKKNIGVKDSDKANKGSQ
jgi:hypothetical protein